MIAGDRDRRIPGRAAVGGGEGEHLACRRRSWMGTTTVPFGCTTGWPPMPVERLAVFTAALQVRPPSVEVLIQMIPLAGGWDRPTPV